MKIQNPVIRGFYPDPSICRANGKYYLAASSFQYMPGVPVLESEDLVNWKTVGYCLTREDQVGLHGVPSSGGVFAPTIRFHNGRFYMVTNQNTSGKNFYVYTDDITGEWSDSIYVDQGGIDPSLLFDGDKVYFTSNGTGPDGKGCIYQCEIDIETGKKLTDSVPVWSGNGGRFLESPHLYHIGDWYYLMAAEGGTEYGHMITYARSKSPFGPFEGYPHNPVLTNRNLGGNENPIQGIGHGDLVSDGNGNYWLVCLGFRQIGEWQPFHHLGREVFLTSVAWGDDGWFTAGTDGTVTEWEEVTLPKETEQKKNSWSVSFADMEVLEKRWCRLRDYEDSNYQIEEHRVSLKGTPVTLEETSSPTFLGIRQAEFDTSLTVIVSGDAQEAGITFYMDESEHYDLALLNRNGVRMAVLRLKVGDVQAVTGQAVLPQDQTSVVLQVESEPEWYHFSILDRDGNRVSLGKARTKYLSSEVAGGFTGVVMGLYAIDENGSWAHFDGLVWEQRDWSFFKRVLE